MNESLLSRLEHAAVSRNPLLAHLLQPGLSEAEVGAISQSEVQGDVSAIVKVYRWRNGTQSHSQLSLLQTSLFPKSIYQFLSLQGAIEIYKTMQQAAAELVDLTGDPTGVSQGVKRYFPLFWDGSNCNLGIDLAPGKQNRVVIIDFSAGEPFREVYQSFEVFLEDAVEANEQDRYLKCFQH